MRLVFQDHCRWVFEGEHQLPFFFFFPFNSGNSILAIDVKTIVEKW